MQVAIDYVVPHLTLKSTVGLTQNPRVVVAATTGQKGVVAGTQATYDTNKGNITTWDASVGYNAADFQAHIMLTEAGMAQQIRHALIPSDFVFTLNTGVHKAVSLMQL